MLIQLIQKKLDNVLLQYGITSHHMRHIETNTICDNDKTIDVNQNEYVVYRIYSSNSHTFGNGNIEIMQHFIDINYYYLYEKNDIVFDDIEERVQAICKEFLTDKHFLLVNGQNDIYDFDNPYRGINIEFKYLGVI